MLYVGYRFIVSFANHDYVSAFVSACIAIGFFVATFASTPNKRMKGECFMIATVLASIIYTF